MDHEESDGSWTYRYYVYHYYAKGVSAGNPVIFFGWLPLAFHFLGQMDRSELPTCIGFKRNCPRKHCGRNRFNAPLMHMKLANFSILILLLCVDCAMQAGAQSAVTLTNLPKSVGTFALSKEVRERANAQRTVELRIVYLASVVSSNAAETSPPVNFRVASAIRLLGVMGNTNAIDVWA